MARTKRLRYEVLRRDGYRCQSCGATAQETKLTVDHVQPVALGGADDPANLQTLCLDCNAGKSSSIPDSEFVAEVEQKADLWNKAMRAAVEMRKRTVARHDEELATIDRAWSDWNYVDSEGKKVAPIDRPQNWESTAELYLERGVPLDDMVRLIRTALAARHRGYGEFREWRYYIGCVKRVLEELEGTARDLISAREAGTPTPEPTDTARDPAFAEPELEDL